MEGCEYWTSARRMVHQISQTSGPSGGSWGLAYAWARQVGCRVWAAMVAAVLVSRPQKVCAPVAGEFHPVGDLAEDRLDPVAPLGNDFQQDGGMAARCRLSGGTRTAVPRAASSASKAMPLKPLSASRSRGARQAEAVEPFGVRGVAAEPGGRVVAGAGPLVRAADPGRMLHRQGRRVDLPRRRIRHRCSATTIDSGSRR
jgi:hypothetical protein